jgi:replicative DNA helicase
VLGPAPEGSPDEMAEVPPHDIRAEEIALGSMMLSPSVLADVAEIVAAADYYRPAHQAVHEVITELRGAGDPTGPAAVLIGIQRRGGVPGVDGLVLARMIEAVPAVVNGPYYARRVAALARTRRAREGLRRALQITASTGFDPDEDMDRVRQAVDDATGTRVAGTARWLSDAVWDVASELEQPLPDDLLTPPYADLREIVPVLRPGQLITVAARPSIGKTVVLGDFARYAALKLGQPVGWFTLEMARDEIILRCIAAEARVSHDRLQARALDDAEWDRTLNAAKRLGETSVLIDDKAGANLAHVRSGLRAMIRVARPALVIFDYLQLGTSPGSPSRQEEVSRLARGFKEIAKDFGLPVVQAAQLNRNPESRHDKRPIQADLRESGEIENSSDVVILLHREDYYEPECARAGEMDLIVTKNRNGRTGQCTVSFQGRFCRCVDMAPEEWSPSAVIGVR